MTEEINLWENPSSVGLLDISIIGQGYEKE
jgi:hypothetical protein